MKKAIFLSMALLLTFGTLLAQGNGQGPGPSAGTGQGSGSNAGLAAGQGQGSGPNTGATTGKGPAGKQDLETVSIVGTVAAVDYLDHLLEFPNITVDGYIDGLEATGIVVKLAPYWFLVEDDFEIVVGEAVEILAFLGTPNATAYYAISINETVLRSDDGSPLWTGGHGSTSVVKSVGMRKCSVKNDCVVPDSISVLEGEVDSVRFGNGLQHLTLLVKLDTGFLLGFRLGPTDYLLANGLELEQGDTVVIRYALTQRTQTWLVLAIGSGEGNMVTLRFDNGDPAWR